MLSNVKKLSEIKLQQDGVDVGSLNHCFFFLSAECPVCGDMIAHRKINSHLDACLTRTEKKSSLRRYKQNKSNITILLTELEGSTEEYQAKVVAVWTKCCKVCTKLTEG